MFAPVARYVIEAGSGSRLANLARIAVAGTGTSFTTDAPPGTCFVRVRAENACGAGPPSSDVWLTAGGGPLPAPPAVVTVTGTVPTYTVQWASVPTAAAYVLEAGSRPGLSDAGAVPVAPSVGA